MLSSSPIVAVVAVVAMQICLEMQYTLAWPDDSGQHGGDDGLTMGQSEYEPIDEAIMKLFMRQQGILSNNEMHYDSFYERRRKRSTDEFDALEPAPQTRSDDPLLSGYDEAFIQAFLAQKGFLNTGNMHYDSFYERRRKRSAPAPQRVLSVEEVEALIKALTMQNGGSILKGDQLHYDSFYERRRRSSEGFDDLEPPPQFLAPASQPMRPAYGWYNGYARQPQQQFATSPSGLLQGSDIHYDSFYDKRKKRGGESHESSNFEGVSR